MQEARAAFAARLREIRIEAGLTASDLAARAGWQRSKVSKIEHARQAPTVADVAAWCEHARATDQMPDLVASLHAVEGMWVEWRRLERSGLRRLQEASIPLFERTRSFRIYEVGVIPSLFQTVEYATARMRRIVEFSGVPDDVDQAVQARMDRQRIVRTGDRTFAVVLEEAALYARIGDTEMMASQLAWLITVAGLPSVSLGIIPRGIARTMWSTPGFWIYDDGRVGIETPTARITITQPREIAIYERTFTELSSMAVVGAPARRIITEAISALDC
ncbi:helix-turn-helix transcriptional regulator [Luedemannella flava]|uniref:helix-turn-helix domain-containing protein n=1 Tax=Luedemannella flava TaxID=349316 RepID=UPI0031D00D90